jgi:hypothetical protein
MDHSEATIESEVTLVAGEAGTGVKKLAEDLNNVITNVWEQNKAAL